MGVMSVTLDRQAVVGPFKFQRGRMSFSSAYSANGEQVQLANDLGLFSLDLILHDFSRDGLLYEYDYANNRMRAFYPIGANTPTGTAVAVMTATVQPRSGATPVTSSAGQPRFGGVFTSGRGQEVQATADMSATVIRFVAIGQ